jgi:hypothetical protein
VRVADGLSWNAIYCTRDLLRELPLRLLQGQAGAAPHQILSIALSRYASRRDRRVTEQRRRRARELGLAYLALVNATVRHAGCGVPELLSQIAARSALINRAERITGDGIDYATARLMRSRHRLEQQEFQQLVMRFVEHQDLSPDRGAGDPAEAPAPAVARVLGRMLRVVRDHREGL